MVRGTSRLVRFDGDMPCRRYAARIVEHEVTYILGFEDHGRDQFVSQIMDPERVVEP